MHGLHILDLRQPSFTDRLLRRKPRENAALELNNFIATAPLLEIEREDVERLLAAHGYALADARPALAFIYQQILKHFSVDKNISEDEQEQLLHIRHVFGITEAEIREIENDILLPIYQDALDFMLSDGELSVEERERLEKLAGDLRLDEGVTRRAYLRAVHTFLQRDIERAVSERRLSTEDEEELRRLAASFGVRMELDQSTRDALERFRFLHRAAAGELPTLDIPIPLQRGEVCYAFAGASYYEMRANTRAMRYGGADALVKILRGVRLMTGQDDAQRAVRDAMRLLDRGTLYFTSKRLLFDGDHRNTQIGLKKIMALTIYEDGVEVEKQAGRDQLFIFNSAADAELLGAIIETILKASRAVT